MCKHLLPVHSKNLKKNLKNNFSMCTVSGAMNINCGFSQILELTLVMGIRSWLMARSKSLMSRSMTPIYKLHQKRCKKQQKEKNHWIYRHLNLTAMVFLKIPVAVDGAWENAPTKQIILICQEKLLLMVILRENCCSCRFGINTVPCVKGE